MPYVSKDDIMAYIPTGISLQQGVANTVEISLFKDYLNNQLNAADADSIVVTLYNSLGQKTYQYANPIVPGQTDRLDVGTPASATQGIISFDITAMQAANLASGNVYAQVTITYSNYYPSAKTYILPQLLIGDNNGSSVPGGEGTGVGSGSGSGSTVSSSEPGGLTPYIQYEVSHVDGSTPDIKSVSFDSSDPTAVTEIIFYNLDKGNHRNVYLENFLENRIDNGVSGTITIVDTDNTRHYSVYNISSYSRINAEAGGGDDNDNDYTKIVVSYEDNSYTPIETPYTWSVGDSISYTLDAFGGASTTSTQPGAQGAQGAQGASGIDGNPGRDGADGATGAQGADGVDGAQGANGADGATGAQGAAGVNGVDGAQGAAGSNGADGAQGAAGSNGVDGAAGAQGAAGANGVAGAQGAQGATGTGITFQGSVANSAALPTTGNTQGDAYLNQDNDSLWIWDGTQWVDGGSIQGPAGPVGMQGAQGADGAAASTGAQGAPGTNGAQGAAGSNGVDGAQGAAGSNGVDGAQGAPGTNGAQGADGLQGNPGPAGPQGAQGDTGTNGAQGAAGSNGADGAQGADGLQGNPGPAGPQGAQGDPGTNGAQGAPGTNGAQGADGLQGNPGPAGPQGAQGDPGTNGAQGAPGTNGAQGAPGTNGAQGADGLQGNPGPTGPQGAQGADGLQGPTGAEGAQGASGTNGSQGAQGADGIGIPLGGTTGQVLAKVDGNNYNTVWTTPTGGSGGGSGATKYLLRLNYDSTNGLISGVSSHSFESKLGYETTGAAINAVTGGSTGSISVSFTESNPMISIMVMAWDPGTNTYKAHHYDKDASDIIINTTASDLTSIGNDQYEPNFFGSFTTSVTLDARLDFIKIGNAEVAGFGGTSKNPHAYVIFIF